MAPHLERAWRAYKDIRIRSFYHTHARTHTTTVSLSHTHTHTHAHTHTSTHAYTYADTQARMHTHTHTLTHTHSHTHTQKHTHTETHTHTHTHTHTDPTGRGRLRKQVLDIGQFRDHLWPCGGWDKMPCNTTIRPYRHVHHTSHAYNSTTVAVGQHKHHACADVYTGKVEIIYSRTKNGYLLV